MFAGPDLVSGALAERINYLPPKFPTRDAITFGWDLNNDGTFGDGGYTSSSINPNWATLVSFGFVPGGMHTVAVRVTDNEGDTDVAKYTVNVGVLSSPIASLSGGHATVGSDLDLKCALLSAALVVERNQFDFLSQHTSILIDAVDDSLESEHG